MTEKIEILIVEDSPTQAERLKTLLEGSGYRVSVAGDGREGLASIHRHEPSLVITDIMMPEMNGYELCRMIKNDAVLKRIPVILMTSLTEPEEILEGLRCKADIFITKPYNDNYLITLVKRILDFTSSNAGKEPGIKVRIPVPGMVEPVEVDPRQMMTLLLSTYEAAFQRNQELVQTQDELRLLNDNLEELVDKRTASLLAEVEVRKQAEIALFQAYEATLDGWSKALDLRDKETEGHSQRVTEMTLKLAHALGIAGNETVHIRRGSLLHDIGKMGVPDEILHKPEPLSEEDWVVMKKHPAFAYDLISPIAYLAPSLDIPYSHHEKWDGSGYPQGLKSGSIPYAARIFAIADVYDALTSDRPYRKAWSVERTLEHMASEAGKHFDPKIMEAFLNMMRKDGEMM